MREPPQVHRQEVGAQGACCCLTPLSLHRDRSWCAQPRPPASPACPCSRPPLSQEHRSSSFQDFESHLPNVVGSPLTLSTPFVNAIAHLSKISHKYCRNFYPASCRNVLIELTVTCPPFNSFNAWRPDCPILNFLFSF